MYSPVNPHPDIPSFPHPPILYSSPYHQSPAPPPHPPSTTHSDPNTNAAEAFSEYMFEHERLGRIALRMAIVLSVVGLDMVGVKGVGSGSLDGKRFAWFGNGSPDEEGEDSFYNNDAVDYDEDTHDGADDLEDVSGGDNYDDEASVAAVVRSTEAGPDATSAVDVFVLSPPPL
ncbi:hypothetical protein GYMLUDRAFT_248683 [Collybiopsis luxurians FD-317 M1]|uniref:Uncharacterized protein n=1 Tax=Collybiopsis luxurians FD-317 M1 TaxID=944289 RepID=A0A0D0AXT9_9AGAR|nr:hypothetical protein GYMLUDRAFT_248683 [Collybiopsis luxurians FD-317 M1]